MAWCENPKGYLLVECAHGGEAYVPVRCRVCESCRLYWYARNMERMMQHLAHERWVAFLTLTSLPGTEWSDLTAALKKLVGWLRRRGIRDYVAVREQGKETGMKHYHLIFTGWLWVDVELLRRQWEKYTGAYEIKLKRVPVNQDRRSICARYVAKYLGKGLASVEHGELPRKCLSWSGGWSKLIRLPSGWRVWWERKLYFQNVAIWSQTGCGLLGNRPICADCFGGLRKVHQKVTIPDKSLAGVHVESG